MLTLQQQLLTPCYKVLKVLALQDSLISTLIYLGNSLSEKAPTKNPPLFSHSLTVEFDSLYNKILKKRSPCSWLLNVVIIMLPHANRWGFFKQAETINSAAYLIK